MLTLRVDVNGLLAGHRMSADDGMLIDNRLAALDAAARRGSVDLLDTRVSRLQTMQALAEEGAEAVVRLGGVDKKGVTAGRRVVEDVQESRSGRLLLVGNVRVPGHGAGAVGEEELGAVVTRSAVHQVNLGVSLRRARGRVDVVAAEVGAVVEGLLDGQVGKVLVPEGDDLALGDEAGELVLAGVGQLAQLDAAHLGAGGWRQVGELDAAVLGKEVGVRRVGVLAVLVVLEGLERGILLSWVPGWEVVGVLYKEARSIYGNSCLTICFEETVGAYVGSLMPVGSSELGVLVVLERSDLLVVALEGGCELLDVHRLGDVDGFYC